MSTRGAVAALSSPRKARAVASDELAAGELAGENVAGRNLVQTDGPQDPAGERHQHADIAGGGVRRDRHRVAQIHRSVGVRCVGAAHGAGDHDRNRTRIGEVQPQRGLFERVGAMRHDDAHGTAVGRGPGRGCRSHPSRTGSTANCLSPSRRRRRRRGRRPIRRRRASAGTPRRLRRGWRWSHRWR